MKIIIEKDYEDLSQTAASIILSEVYKDCRVNVDLTDGSTPKRTYEIVAETMKKNTTDYSNVHYYNHAEMQGEYHYIKETLKKEIHVPFGVNEANIHSLNFDKQKEYIDEIVDAGGIDLMVLGVGADGHFCVNFPGATKFDEDIYAIKPSAILSMFDGGTSAHGDVGDFDVESLGEIATFGFKAVLRAKRVLVLVSGVKKADAVNKMLNGPVTEDVPASILRMHPNIVLIVDQEAASLL